MLLVGITHTDTKTEADYIAKKVAQLRVFGPNSQIAVCKKVEPF